MHHGLHGVIGRMFQYAVAERPDAHLIDDIVAHKIKRQLLVENTASNGTEPKATSTAPRNKGLALLATPSAVRTKVSANAIARKMSLTLEYAVDDIMGSAVLSLVVSGT